MNSSNPPNPVVVKLTKQKLSTLNSTLIPQNTTQLIVSYNNLKELPALPPTLEVLQCNENKITRLPELPTSLRVLRCQSNKIEIFPTLPNSLEELHCGRNKLTTLPTLPNHLEKLNCTFNKIKTLSNLPDSLQYIECNNNQITTIDRFPASLKEFDCYQNNIDFPTLPDSLEKFSCGENKLTSLPALPLELRVLKCTMNNIVELPSLPPNLEELNANYNKLTSLPPLPKTLVGLYVDNNKLTSLPPLPVTLEILNVNYNNLTLLPPLPNTLLNLHCNNNQITTIPLFPASVIHIDFHLNPLIEPYATFWNDYTTINVDNPNKIQILRNSIELAQRIPKAIQSKTQQYKQRAKNILSAQTALGSHSSIKGLPSDIYGNIASSLSGVTKEGYFDPTRGTINFRRLSPNQQVEFLARRVPETQPFGITQQPYEEHLRGLQTPLVSQLPIPQNYPIQTRITRPFVPSFKQTQQLKQQIKEHNNNTRKRLAYLWAQEPNAAERGPGQSELARINTSLFNTRKTRKARKTRRNH